jgi:GNAT superfamily N-acetyltransferase
MAFGERACPFEPEDYDRAVAGDEVWVAESAGLVVGFVSVYRPEGDVRHIYVDPDWQHRGIGSCLLASACAGLRGPARLRCHADNRAACAFYERNGWIPEAREPAFVLYRK